MLVTVSKIFGTLLLAVLVLGFMSGTAGAVIVSSDVKGTKYEEACAKLAALGILQGYSDGTFKPEEKITRAEMAVVVVRALGQDRVINASGNKPTGFSDVPAEHWASRYIQIACAVDGIIKGYSDGTFKPEANITYAEVVTMLVRMLGYGPTVDGQGDWPINYLAKAASLGILKEVSFMLNDPATRGNVALMTVSCLGVDVMEKQIGKNTWKINEGKSFVEEGFHVEKDVLVEQVDLFQDKVKLSNGEAYPVLDLDPVNYLGLEVKAWLNDLGEIVYLDVQNKNELIEDKIKEAKLSEDGGVTGFKLKDKEQTYFLAPDAKVYYNYYKVALDELGQFTDWKDAKIKVVLNGEGEIQRAMVTDNDIYVTHVERVDEKSSRIYTGDDKIDLENEDYKIIKDGKAIKPDELSVNDIIHVFVDFDAAKSTSKINEQKDNYYILVSTKTKSGKVTRYHQDGSKYCIFINDETKEITLDPKYIKNYEYDGDENEFSNIDPDEFFDGKVTLYYDLNSKVRYMVID